EHRSGDGRLGDRRFVEILELAHLGARKRSLKRPIGALDLGYELGDLIVLGNARWRDLLALAVEAADEADFGEQLGSAAAAEVEDPVLLANLGGKHVCSPIAAQAGAEPPVSPRPGGRRMAFPALESRLSRWRRPEI